MGELVSLEPRTMESEKGKLKEDTEDDTVDLAEKMDHVSSKGGLSFRQCELVRNFMRNNASQLTKKGLSCLQAEVEDNELCVFFRNNHFNTMFKHDGDLYILATDEGLSQPDLVWEKLNEVNGDTIFMTGSFKEFKVEGNSNGTWDEQDALASTADYLTNVKTEDQESSSFKFLCFRRLLASDVASTLYVEAAQRPLFGGLERNQDKVIRFLDLTKYSSKKKEDEIVVDINKMEVQQFHFIHEVCGKAKKNKTYFAGGGWNHLKKIHKISAGDTICCYKKDPAGQNESEQLYGVTFHKGSDLKERDGGHIENSLNCWYMPAGHEDLGCFSCGKQGHLSRNCSQ